MYYFEYKNYLVDTTYHKEFTFPGLLIKNKDNFLLVKRSSMNPQNRGREKKSLPPFSYV